MTRHQIPGRLRMWWRTFWVLVWELCQVGCDPYWVQGFVLLFLFHLLILLFDEFSFSSYATSSICPIATFEIFNCNWLVPITVPYPLKYYHAVSQNTWRDMSNQVMEAEIGGHIPCQGMVICKPLLAPSETNTMSIDGLEAAIILVLNASVTMWNSSYWAGEHR